MIAMLGALAAAGCGSSDSSSTGESQTGGGQTEAESTTKVEYRGPFVTNGGDAPYYYARKLGYYAEEGLEVDIRDSKGSSQTITDVVSGGSDIGEAASTNVILAAGEGQPVTSVATPVGRSSFGFFVPEDSGINSIGELAGSSILATSLVAPNMYAALAAGGVSKSDVKPVFADPTALITTYLGGDVDSMYTTALLAGAVAQARPSKVLLQSDAGYNPPDYSLVVTQETLEDDPEMVAGFTRATLRGFQAAKENPQAAVDALLADHPELDPAVALGTLEATFGFYCSATQKGQPYGENAEEDWTGAAEALAEFAGLTGSTKGSRFYTNQLFKDAGLADIPNC
jgi:NitT/TauT family transport system substrate-binding protein